MADHPAQALGPRVFAYLTDDEAQWPTDGERDTLALRVRAALPSA
jgi:hypothetical protein